MDSLNAVLKQQAVGLGLCEKWTQEWDHSYDDWEFCQKFKSGQDFCIKHEYPSLDFVRKYFQKSELMKFGVFVDDLPVRKLENGTYVCLGDCEGTLEFPRWGTALVYIRHSCRIKISAGDFARVRIKVYDNAEVETETGENAIVRIVDRRL